MLFFYKYRMAIRFVSIIFFAAFAVWHFYDYSLHREDMDLISGISHGVLAICTTAIFLDEKKEGVRGK